MQDVRHSFVLFVCMYLPSRVINYVSRSNINNKERN